MSFIAVGAAVVSVGASAGAAYLSAGDKPKVPGVPQIDMNALQKDAIAGNMAAVGPAGELASKVNQTNQSELDRIREGTMPGGKAAAQKIIMDQLMGVADITDTQAGIRNATAAGFNLGVGGSQFSKFGIVGHLGRTVGQQKQQGLGNMMAFQQFSEAPRFNPASMFLSPEARLRVVENERNMRYQAAVAQAGIDAQPSKGAQAAAGGLGALSGIAGMFSGSMMGAPKSIPTSGSWYSGQGWKTPQAPPSYFGTPSGQWG